MKKLVALLLVAYTFGAHGQSANYAALNGPYGGELYDIIQTNSGKLLGISSGQGIVGSTDGGATWTLSNGTITEYYLRDLEYDPVSEKTYALSGNRLYSSADNGVTWLVVAQSGFFDASFLRRGANGYLYIANASGTIWRSIDNGITWPAPASTALPGPINVYDMEVSSTGYIFVATSSFVYRSNSPNSAAGFTQYGSTAGIAEADALIWSLTISGTEVYASSYFGPYKSTNNAVTWTSVKSNITDGSFYNSRIEQKSGTIYLVNYDYRKIHKSMNGGTSWTTVTYPTDFLGGDFYGWTRSVFLESATTIYVSYDNLGTLKSIDGGVNWADASYGCTGLSPNTVTMTDNGRLLFAWPGGVGMYWSVDDGASWDFLSSAPLNSTIDGIKKMGSTLYAYGSKFIKSIDNGSTWEVQNSGTTSTSCQAYFRSFTPRTATEFYSHTTYDCSSGISGLYLLKSSDAGVTWVQSAIITGLPPGSNYYIEGKNQVVDASGNNYFHIYNYDVYKWQLYKVNPSTLVATEIPLGEVNDLEYFNGKLYAVTLDQKLNISSDEGQTWTSKTIPASTQYGQVRIISDNTFYMLYLNAYISIDGGNTWTDTGNFGNGRLARDVIISPTNYAYVAVDNGPVFKSVAPVVPPAAPTALTSYANGIFNVGLKFTDNSTNESHFIIEWSVGDNLHYDSLTNYPANSTNFIIRNVQSSPNAINYYRVRAASSAGKSAYSNEISVTTPVGCGAGTIPANRSWTATTADESGVGVMVNNLVTMTGAGGINFTVDNLTIGATAGISPGIPPQFSASFLEECGNIYLVTNGPYVYANGNGTWDSNTATLTIHWQTRPNFSPYRAETTVFTLNAADPAPSAPGASAYIKTQDEVVVTWSGSTFGQQYQVQRSTTSGSGYVNVGAPVTTGTLLFVDQFAFAVGTTYYYRVVASSVGGASTPSAEFPLLFQTPLFNAESLVGFDFPTQGVSWADIDDDDDDDLILTPFNQFDVNYSFLHIFENTAGTLQKITVPGVSDYSISTFRGLSVADVNNDGRTDFLSVGPQSGGDIFINQGGKVFERTNILPADNSGLQWYASLVDFNNDGKMDAVVEEDVINPLNGLPITTKMKLLSQKTDGTFEPYEVGEIAADVTISRGGSWADYDNDGDQDFLRTRFNATAADFDQLYRNNGDGTFTAVTGTAFEQDFTMQPRTSSWADFDNDLDLDVFVGHNAGGLSNALYQNNGDGTFTKLTASLVGEAKLVTESTFGSAWGDIDNDGDLDLMVANSGQCALYRNNGTGNFTKYTGAEYLVANDPTRTNITFAVSDYDKNGSLDIAPGKNIAGFPTIVLKNNLVIGANTRWLQVKLVGTISNRSGIGARIVITTPDNKKQMRHISSHTGYGSAGSLKAHFGLRNQASVSKIEVFWPSGVHQVISTSTAANQTITITEDGTGPLPITLFPAHAAANVGLVPKIEVTLNEASVAVAGKKLTIVKNSDLTTNVFSLDLSTAVKAGEKYTFTLPSGLEASTAYRVNIEAGAFNDQFGNPSLAMGGPAWSFTTGSIPAATAYLPAAGAVNVPVNTNLEITFDRAVTPVSGKKLTVKNGTTVVADADVTTGTMAANKFTLDLVNNLSFLQTLEVTMQAGAFVDPSTQIESAAVSAGQWTFQTVEAPDTQAPSLSYDPTPVAMLDKGFSDKTLSVTAADNKAVTAVTMFYRKTSENAFISKPLTLNGGNGKWEGILAAADVNDMGIEYYFKGVDAAKNKVFSPGPATDSTKFYTVKIKFTGSNTPSIQIPSGGTEGSWRIIAVPYDLANNNNQVADIFGSMGEATKNVWRLIRYSAGPPESWLEYPANFSTIERGKGYFINAKEGKQITLDNPTAPAYSRSNLFEIALVKGFNQIGNPYTIPINWDDIQAFNDASNVGKLKLFASNTYTPGTTLQPGQGGFVLLQNAATVKFSFPGQTSAGGRIKSDDFSQDLGSDNWLLKLKLEQGKISNEFGAVGMHAEAAVDYDQFDDFNGPRFIDFLELNFDHSEHFMGRFARDVVPKADDYTWEFTVASNMEGMATLRWDNAGFGANDREIFLFDIARQVPVDMREQRDYSFDSRASSRFRLYFGKNVKPRIMPEKVSLGAVFPNPTSGVATIPFSLPENNRKFAVLLEVFDIVGKKVGTVLQGDLEPGFYQEEWQVGETTLADGLYTYRLVVDGGKNGGILSGKIVLKR